MPGFFPRFFLSSSNMATRCDRRSLDPLSMSPWVYATGSCATSVVTEGHVTPSEVSLGCSLRRPRPIFSMVTGTSHPRLIFTMVTGTKHPRPIFSVVTGTSPDYLPLLFSYSVYIGCVVLQGCLRSHCGISKSQMVNLIPTCIVSSKKIYFRMILLNSEKTMYRKLCNTRSSSKQCWLGCSLRRPCPITLGNPMILLNSEKQGREGGGGGGNRLCSTTRMVFLRVHLKISSCNKCFFFIFLHLMFKIRQQLTKIKIDKFHGRFVITCG